MKQIKNVTVCTFLIVFLIVTSCKKDISVNPQSPPTSVCYNNNRPQISARLVPIGNLSKPRMAMAVASAGNKIVFAGGISPDCPECWGSARVDIYDVATGTWSKAELKDGRWGIATVTAGNKIFFVGGEFGDGAFDTYYSTVDIYDVSTDSWSVASLSHGRSKIAAAAVGDKVLLAGGETPHDYSTTNTVDIFNISTNNWSTANLSEPRAHISAVTLGNKIYFAGGHIDNRWYGTPSKTIDVYDNATSSWSTLFFNEPMGFIAGTTLGENIYWASGCKLQIRNVNTATNSVTYLSSTLGKSIRDHNAVVNNNKILLFKDDDNRFDIYDVSTNSWSIGVLPVTFWGASIICVNNTVYVAGGSTSGSFSPSDQVYRLEF